MTPAHVAGLARIALAPAALLLLTPWPNSREVVAGVVVVAIITDILDGYLARKMGTVSTFGVYLDLTADKVFVCGLLAVMSVAQLVPAWIMFVVVARELIVMGLRSFAAAEGFVVPADTFGAAKAVLLFAGVLLELLIVPYAVYILVAGTVAAVASGLNYGWKIRKLVMKKQTVDFNRR